MHNFSYDHRRHFYPVGKAMVTTRETRSRLGALSLFNCIFSPLHYRLLSIKILRWHVLSYIKPCLCMREYIQMSIRRVGEDRNVDSS